MNLEALKARLQSCIDDPMWADHAEVSKATLRAAVAALAAPSAEPVGGFELTRSIIHDCPAIKLPQSWVEKLGNVAQLVALKGADATIAARIVNTLNATPAQPPAAQAVCREFTNELGNRIKITIEGPTSVSENILTPKEVHELHAALAEAIISKDKTT